MGQGDVPEMKVQGKALVISVGSGLPKNSSLIVFIFVKILTFLDL